MTVKAEPSPPSLPSLQMVSRVAVSDECALRRKTLSRNASIAIAVVALHVAFLWALQSGLLIRAAERVVPVELLAQFVEPPAPKIESATPAVARPQIKPQMLPTPVKKTVAKPVMQPAPQPLAVADPTPSPNAPVGVITPQPSLTPTTAPITTSVAPSAAAVVAAATPMLPATTPTVQLPSSDADYLQNPSPPYPPISRRLNEQGRTTVRVLIGIDGLPQRSEVAKSSGFERLDQAALVTVMRWRFVPGKRGGVPEAMWFNVPINWVLQ